MSPVSETRRSSKSVAWVSVMHPDGPMKSICVQSITLVVPVKGATYTCTAGTVKLYIFEIAKSLYLSAAPRPRELNKFTYTPQDMRALQANLGIGSQSPKLTALDSETHRFGDSIAGSSTKQVISLPEGKFGIMTRAQVHALLHKHGISH